MTHFAEGITAIGDRNQLYATVQATMGAVAARYEQEVARPLDVAWAVFRAVLQRWPPNAVSNSGDLLEASWRFQYPAGDRPALLDIRSRVRTAQDVTRMVEPAVAAINEHPAFKKAPEPLLGVHAQKGGREYRFSRAHLLSRLGEVLPPLMDEVDISGSDFVGGTARSLRRLEEQTEQYDEYSMCSYSPPDYLRSAEMVDNETSWLAQTGVQSPEAVYASLRERFVDAGIRGSGLVVLQAATALLMQETTIPYCDYSESQGLVSSPR